MNEHTPIADLAKRAAQKRGLKPILPSNNQPELSAYERKAVPVYDRGGDVDLLGQGNARIQSLIDAPDERAAKFASNQPINISPMSLPKKDKTNPDVLIESQGAIDNIKAPAGGSVSAPAMPLISMPNLNTVKTYDKGGYVGGNAGLNKILTLTPNFDKGGKVNVDDGNHTLAILENGERVLTPEQNQKYKRMGLDKLKVYDEGGDVQAAPQQPDLIPERSSLNTEQKPISGMPKIQMDPNNESIPMRGSMEQGATKPQSMMGAEEKAQRRAIDTDVKKALGSGNLVKLGMARIAEKHLPDTEDSLLSGITAPAALQPVGGPRAGYTRMTVPADENTPAPQITTRSTSDNNNMVPLSHKAKLADYDAKLAAARDAGDKAKYDTLSWEKEQYLNSTPWGSSENHPGLLGKIGHVAAKVGNIAGDVLSPGVMAIVPGTDLNNRIQERGTLNQINLDTENALKGAETQEKKAQAKALANPAEKAGDYQIEKDDDGNLWRISKTDKEPPMMVSFGAQGQPTLTTPPAGAKVPTLTTQGAPTFGNKHTPENAPADISGFADQAKAEFVDNKGRSLVTDGQIQAELKALGPNPTQKMMADSLNKLQSFAQERARENDADKARIDAGKGAEDRAEARERRQQEAKDKNVIVYADDGHGQLVKTNRYDAQQRGVPYEEMSIGDMNKDRQALRQLNDVQLNTSRYTKAANDYDAAKLNTAQRAADNVNLNGMLNKAGIGDFNVAISEGGKVDIPLLSSFLEGLSRQQRSNDYHQLSPEGKALFDGYVRTMAAIPAYQKALTGIGRSNKEMLDLELANIPSPLLDAKDIIRKQGQFQENIERATEGFPINLPGLKTPKQVREETEGKTTASGTNGYSANNPFAKGN